MGLLRVRGRLTGPTDRSEDAELLVDTGATLPVVPGSLAARLELVARRSRPVLIAGGQRAEWPVAEVRLAPRAGGWRGPVDCPRHRLVSDTLSKQSRAWEDDDGDGHLQHQRYGWKPR